LAVWDEACRPQRLPQEPDAELARRWVAVLIPRWQYLEPSLKDERVSRKAVVRRLTDVSEVQPLLGIEEAALAELVAREAAGLLKMGGWEVSSTTYNRCRVAGVRHLQHALEKSSGVWASTRGRRVSAAALPPLPPLPRLRIERAEQPELVAALTGGGPRALVLYGGAGMGKTTLVGQVLREDEVQTAFPGGIAWASGTQPVEKIAEAWCRGLGLNRQVEGAWMQCWQEQDTRQGRVLLVLDDVSTIQDLAELREGLGPETTLLLTTREASVVPRELVHQWVAPEALLEFPVGPFTPAEGRALVEQARDGAGLRAEEWAVVEELGRHLGWSPDQMARYVAAQPELAAWREALTGLVSGQPLRDRRAALPLWLSLTAPLDAAERPLGVAYAAAVWQVAAPEARRRLQQLTRLGLLQEVTPDSKVSGGLVAEMWQFPRVELAQHWAIPMARAVALERQQQRGRLARAILRASGPEWRVPWQFRLLSPPWVVVLLVGDALWEWGGERWRRGAGARWSLARAEVVWRKEGKWWGAFLPLEYRCLLDGLYTQLPHRSMWVVGVGLIVGLLLVVLAAGPWLASWPGWQRVVSYGAEYGFPVLLVGVVLWLLWQLSISLWLAYLLGVPYAPLPWLLRIAGWLGMREPDARDD